MPLDRMHCLHILPLFFNICLAQFTYAPAYWQLTSVLGGLPAAMSGKAPCSGNSALPSYNYASAIPSWSNRPPLVRSWPVVALPPRPSAPL
jgi:hypothetical protein